MADNFEDVPDSTDWLSTPLPALSAVEASLRCQVCKDFFKTPMITSCCHTFCSLCIRRALSNDGKCPLCRASDQELKLRSNWSLEEVVDSFVKARKDTLHFARTAGQDSQREPSGSAAKRRLAEENGEQQPETKRLRSSTRLSRTRSGQAAAAPVPEVDEVDEMEEVQEDNESEDADFAPEDGLVPCPICSTRMKEAQVFRHLDTCDGSKPPPQQHTAQARASASRTPTPNTPARGAGPSRSHPPPERLPALAYSMLKDVALRKKMSDLGLSVTGGRVQLEKRHKEWVTLWNANCDSARPKRRTELLHDLDVWERTQGSKAAMFVKPGVAVKDKEFDGVAWAAKHDTSFKDLIANARKSRAQAKPKSEEEGKGTATPKSEDGGAASAETGAPKVDSERSDAAVIDLTEQPTDAPREGGVEDGPTGSMMQVDNPALKPQVPASSYYLQDGFSEPQIPSGQEAR
ncbi:DNA repair protein rad18 [Colletotrichum scovillei]|uniref:Postreplication repair E3 ubiquitin-protein ligase RAD18 n=1 Tax=Colletotrichum scovillei TaxID=1209932 RepID=A0A9P7R2A7_9PEZI|nr:DNA repair protein rad18 [Colletotrichum scovillei]KAF4774243.1 DNA repair protein rad18 [Colletotrichum scovillei]KAG7048243.1 e3 ubiquitin-protein ligase rad18 [Colletotrichum scovillei]KAG7065452.1 e3 ubiquitin-protein ligase rad18 [Colletotrichum scovillei]KAG7068011.1 e3 ubiquitin-protein ligase rad18 [Colletotrichum scovillei]